MGQLFSVTLKLILILSLARRRLCKTGGSNIVEEEKHRDISLTFCLQAHTTRHRQAGTARVVGRDSDVDTRFWRQPIKPLCL